MRHSALLLLVALVAGAAAALVVIREQRHANQQLLATLHQVSAMLSDESKRSRERDQQMAALNDRIVALEREVAALEERVRSLSLRPAAIVRSSPPLHAIALAPIASSPDGLAPASPDQALVIETLPITWATDWRAYQPAGIIAPPAPVVFEKWLADPAFLKKLYVGYAALQIGDILTTTAAIRRGASEGNPLIRRIADSPAALVGVKAAAGVAMVITMEKLREKHPVAASLTVIAMNAVLAAVTINNVAVDGRQNRANP